MSTSNRRCERFSDNQELRRGCTTHAARHGCAQGHQGRLLQRCTFDFPLLVLIRKSIPPQARLFKSLKLWSFYCDLEESIGTMESTKAVYDKILELKIANAQTIVNYATFLEENKYFEESFKVYERGIELFNFPVAFEIWNIYLSKFVKRYVSSCLESQVRLLMPLKGGKKLERARDLFEQALENCPPKHCKPLYLMYAQLEEEHGLAKRAMGIYDRAATTVQDEDKFDVSTREVTDTALTIRCTRFTLPRRLPTLVFLPHDLSTSGLWKLCRTERLPKCVAALLLSSASSAKSTVLVPSMPTPVNSATLARTPISGKSGTNSKVSCNCCPNGC
jgi:tetratricopeptide (TPR) repeat protein